MTAVRLTVGTVVYGRIFCLGILIMRDAMMAIKMTAMVVRHSADWSVAATGLRIRVKNVTIAIKTMRTGVRMLVNSLSAAMVFGARGDFPPSAKLLIPERVVPVSAPGFLERYGPFDDPAQFANVPLLHLETTEKARWLTWATWLVAHGVAREPEQGDLGLNTYGFVIQAALAEQGLALGWIGLVDHHLAQGSLIQVGPEISRHDRGYWLVPSPSAHGTTAALLDWLINET